jgi:hypothetical protein|tara:strand:+ start:198 stop:398 length:201 start_codon:yes stop_codon:yes gene_type:complete
MDTLKALQDLKESLSPQVRMYDSISDCEANSKRERADASCTATGLWLANQKIDAAILIEVAKLTTK